MCPANQGPAASDVGVRERGQCLGLKSLAHAMVPGKPGGEQETKRRQAVLSSALPAMVLCAGVAARTAIELWQRGFAAKHQPSGSRRMPSFRQVINKTVAENRFLVVPGAHDALSARLIEQAGFAAYFIGGFPVVGARYGVPDMGLRGLARSRRHARHHDGLRPAGADRRRRRLRRRQERDAHGADLRAHGRRRDPHRGPEWPKRCGHMAGKDVVPAERRSERSRAAARADAIRKPGPDRAHRRTRRCTVSTRRCGAPSATSGRAPTASSSRRRATSRSSSASARVRRAAVLQPAGGGHTPILSMEEMHQLGFDCAVLGLDTIMHAAKAIETVLLDMKSGNSRGATTAWTSRSTSGSSATTNGKASTKGLRRRVGKSKARPLGRNVVMSCRAVPTRTMMVGTARRDFPRVEGPRARRPTRLHQRRLALARSRAPDPSGRGCAGRCRRTASACRRPTAGSRRSASGTSRIPARIVGAVHHVVDAVIVDRELDAGRVRRHGVSHHALK